MEDNLVITDAPLSVEPGTDSAAQGGDKSVEGGKKDSTPTNEQVADEISVSPSGKTQEGLDGTHGSNGGLNRGTRQDVAQVDRAAPAAAIKQAVEVLRENNVLISLPEIKELLSQIVAGVQAAATVPPAAYPSLEKADDIRESLRQTVLDGYREEYKELSEVWKGLETKAQGTVTIAGIFIAAAFTFAKDLTDTRLDFYGNLMLGAVIILLIPSVMFSVMALITREVAILPSGERLQKLADDLIEVQNAELPKVKRGFIDDQVQEWQDVIIRVKDAIAEKERWLRTAQGFLLIAISIAAMMTLKLLKV